MDETMTIDDYDDFIEAPVIDDFGDFIEAFNKPGPIKIDLALWFDSFKDFVESFDALQGNICHFMEFFRKFENSSDSPAFYELVHKLEDAFYAIGDYLPQLEEAKLEEYNK